LATVIDVHTRMVIGYAMDDNYRTPLISAALRNAANKAAAVQRHLPLRSRQQLHLQRVRPHHQ
jgi:transposase InsO family protein